MRFHLPSALRRWAGGDEIVEMRLPPDMRVTIGEALAMLGREYPGIRQRVLDDQNNIRRHVNVFVDGENVRFMKGSATPVTHASEVWIYPALSGGVAENAALAGSRIGRPDSLMKRKERA